MPGYSSRGLLQTRQSSFSKISDIPGGLEKSTLEHRKNKTQRFVSKQTWYNCRKLRRPGARSALLRFNPQSQGCPEALSGALRYKARPTTLGRRLESWGCFSTRPSSFWLWFCDVPILSWRSYILEKLNAMLGILQRSWLKDPAGAKICGRLSFRPKCVLVIFSWTTWTSDHL